MDKKIFLKCYNFSSKNKIAKTLFSGIARASSWVFFALYAFFILSLFYNEFSNSVIIKSILIPAITVLVNLAIRKKIARKRPFDELDIEPFIEHGNSFSFPSNHSVSSMAIAMAILNVYTNIGVYILILVIITGTARVFTGLHYPSDVIAGLFIGVLFAAVGFLS